MPIKRVSRSFPWKSFRYEVLADGRQVIVGRAESLPGGVLRLTRAHSPDLPQIAAEFAECKELTVRLLPRDLGAPVLRYTFVIEGVEALPIDLDPVTDDVAPDRVDVRVSQRRRELEPAPIE